MVCIVCFDVLAVIGLLLLSRDVDDFYWLKLNLFIWPSLWLKISRDFIRMKWMLASHSLSGYCSNSSILLYHLELKVDVSGPYSKSVIIQIRRFCVVLVVLETFGRFLKQRKCSKTNKRRSGMKKVLLVFKCEKFLTNKRRSGMKKVGNL